MNDEIEKYYLKAYHSCNPLTEAGEKEAKDILRRNGWFSNREIETREMEEFLIENGYEVFPAVKLFLQEFGNLKIRKRIITEDGMESYDRHYTNPIKKLNYYYMFSGHQLIESYIKEKITPVGTLYTNTIGLFISESGKVFSETHKIGNTFMEAWQNILIY